MNRNLRAALLLGLALFAAPAIAQVNGGGGTAGGSVSVTSATPNIVVTPSPGTGTFTIGATVVLNAQTGTTYTVLSADAGKLVTFSNAAAVAVTLPQATGSFTTGFSFTVQNKGAGTVTITPTTSTINGSATLALTQNQGCDITSDGTNWQVSSCTALGSSSGGITVGTTAITSGTTTRLLYDNAGVVGESSAVTWNGTTLTLSGFTGTGTIDLSGTSGANLKLNAGSTINVGTAARVAFDASNVYLTPASGGSFLIAPCVLVTAGSSGGGLACATATATSPSLLPNWGSGTTGWGGAAGTISGTIAGVEKIRLTAEGIQYKQATAPTVGGTATPSIATGSTDEAGEVTAGTSATSVTITFNLTHTNAPFCVVTAQPQIASFAYTISNTVITITQTATTGDKIDYRCTFP